MLRCLHFGAAPGREPCPTASLSWGEFVCTWVTAMAPGGSMGPGLTPVPWDISYSGNNLRNGEIQNNDTACFLLSFNVPPKAQAYLRSVLQLGEAGSFPAAALLFWMGNADLMESPAAALCLGWAVWGKLLGADVRFRLNPTEGRGPCWPGRGAPELQDRALPFCVDAVKAPQRRGMGSPSPPLPHGRPRARAARGPCPRLTLRAAALAEAAPEPSRPAVRAPRRGRAGAAPAPCPRRVLPAAARTAAPLSGRGRREREGGRGGALRCRGVPLAGPDIGFGRARRAASWGGGGGERRRSRGSCPRRREGRGELRCGRKQDGRLVGAAVRNAGHQRGRLRGGGGASPLCRLRRRRVSGWRRRGRVEPTPARRGAACEALGYLRNIAVR